MQIKFRGKDIETGEWRYGYYFCVLGQHKIINSSGQEYFVDEDSVGQFTGISDKKGDEIYDGDIVMCYTNNGDYVYTLPREVKFQEFCNEMWDNTNCEVIGNVFDNSELLTQ